MPKPAPALEGRAIGRYGLFAELASGGMATVHVGRLLGPAGFSRTVAIKRLHAQFARDPEFVDMFLDEALLASRIRHPNVVSTLDIVTLDGEVFVVMDFVHGETLSKLARLLASNGERIPTRILLAVISGALHGLHAAHEAKNDHGEPLNIVHRDVSPQNIMVGLDGVTRVLDFGVAKAVGQIHETGEGRVKGKWAYMAPEQLEGQTTRRSDIYSAGVVLWEALTGRRLFAGANPAAVCLEVVHTTIPAPSSIVSPVSPRLDQIVLKAVSRAPEDRWSTAREMAIAIEDEEGIATAREVGEWVEHVAGPVLAARASVVADVESFSTRVQPRDGIVVGLDRAPVESFRPPGRVAALDGEAQLENVPTASGPNVVSSAELQAHRRRRQILVAVVVLLMMFTALFALVGHLEVDAASPEAVPSASPVASVYSPMVASELPKASAAPASAPPTSDALPPASTVVPTRSPEPRSHTNLPRRRKRASEPDCNPPYRVDGDGIRYFRPECVR
ncbi:MAG: serine/threonine protein kinase [Polyangiaceae bacterium]|nr:serine/threonine protein kinase [Polyangiaceae bacterium]